VENTMSSLKNVNQKSRFMRKFDPTATGVWRELWTNSLTFYEDDICLFSTISLFFLEIVVKNFLVILLGSLKI
jgi:hypothetical protein